MSVDGKKRTVWRHTCFDVCQRFAAAIGIFELPKRLPPDEYYSLNDIQFGGRPDPSVSTVQKRDGSAVYDVAVTSKFGGSVAEIADHDSVSRRTLLSGT